MYPWLMAGLLSLFLSLGYVQMIVPARRALYIIIKGRNTFYGSIPNVTGDLNCGCRFILLTK